MRLTFSRPHKSIDTFPEIQLPRFTLITGVNGVGKSHLLEAIENGSVACDVAAPSRNEIRLFDWTTLRPRAAANNQGAFDSIASLDQAYHTYLNRHGATRTQLLELAKEYGLGGDHARLSWLTRASQDEYAAVLGDSNKGAAAHAAAERLMRLIGIDPREALETKFQQIAQRTGKSLFDLDQKDFFGEVLPRFGRTELFAQSFKSLFVSYRELQFHNEHQRFRASEGYDGATPISDEEFVGMYGRPPWEAVNSALNAARLGFRINAPPRDTMALYQPELTKVGTGARVDFKDLSSGEQILMSLVLYLYYGENTELLSDRPKVLLFDEIDAPLHPSMTRSALSIILETMVREHGVYVVATTHAPTTVALAPEESVFTMRAGSPGVQKTSRSEALNALLVGVPTLAMSFDGRRQVIVESHIDAAIYAKAYEALRSEINSDRSLEFIAAGSSSNGQSKDQGCASVKRLVDDLEKAGNTSVLGLIDWDGTNSPVGRVSVLCEHKRDGLENLFFDPLLLAALLVRERLHLDLLDVRNVVDIPKFWSLNSVQLQAKVDALQAHVLERASDQRRKIHYVGGFELNIEDAWLFSDDHDLTELIFSRLPNLRSIEKTRPGNTIKRLCDTVLVEKPEFAPTELVETFRALLQS